MISPLHLVHPLEQDKQQLDQGILLYGVLLFIILQFTYQLIGQVYYVIGLLILPKTLVVLAPHQEFKIIDETKHSWILFPLLVQDLQKLTSHILTTLLTSTVLEGALVRSSDVLQQFLKFVPTVKINDRLIFFRSLHYQASTLIGSRGLPRALSVLGLINCPGGYIQYIIPFHHVFALHE